MRFKSTRGPDNDNATAREAPVVRTPRGRPDAAYACADGVLLPLRFARRMPGWQGVRDSRMSRRVMPREPRAADHPHVR
jgi:hypothetical protein